VDVTQEEVKLDGALAQLVIVRAGRLGLYCLSPDGQRAGRYSPERGEYVILPADYVRHVARLRQMADDKRFTDLVSLPLVEVK